jgi:S1-C subfamily serine protease
MTGTIARAAAAVVVAASVTLATAGTAMAAEPSAPPGPGTSPQQATAAEKAAAEVRPAIVYLTETFSAYVSDGTPNGYFNGGHAYTVSATCTGFGVNPQGYIATAGHCVDTTSPDGIRADFIAQAARDVAAADPTLTLQDVVDFGLANWTVEGTAKGSPIEARYAAVIGSGTGNGAKGQAVPARLVDFRPPSQGDVALLKIERSDLPSVQLGTDADTAIGTPVLSIGYPAAADAITDTTLEPSTKDGQISTRRTIAGVPYYETSASLSPGMSGGPTVDMRGEVLGINSAHLPNDQAFNFIAPATGLSELLARNGVHNQLGPNDTLYRDALAAYYAGHYTDAIAGFERLLLVDPDHGQAQQVKTEAAKAKERFGDTPVVPTSQQTDGNRILGVVGWLFWTVVGGAAAVVVGVIALLVALLRRHRRRDAVPVPDIPAQRLADHATWTPRGQAVGRPQAPRGSTPLPGQTAQPSTWPQPGAAPAGAPDGPTVLVTPADIMAAQHPAPASPFLDPAAPSPATVDAPPVTPVNGSDEQTAAATAATAAPTAVAVPTVGSCTTCGSSGTPGAAFCATCGTRLS